MLITVMLQDGSMEYVSPQGLENLIASDQLFCFRRSEGWVVLGRDKVRDPGADFWGGRERRVQPCHIRPPFLVR